MTKTTKSNSAATAEVPLLTDDQIRAMGEKDYMNAAQMAFFKAKLQQLEKDLLKNAGETTEHLRETVLVPDPADRATIEEEHALELRTRDRERKLLKNAGETTEHLRETVLVPDPADRATIEEEHALELRTRDRERKLLKKIEQSIGRIDAGDYGYCDETGEAIGVGRLLARPTATLSLEAQQRRELKQKMFGD